MSSQAFVGKRLSKAARQRAALQKHAGLHFNLIQNHMACGRVYSDSGCRLQPCMTAHVQLVQHLACAECTALALKHNEVRNCKQCMKDPNNELSAAKEVLKMTRSINGEYIRMMTNIEKAMQAFYVKMNMRLMPQMTRKLDIITSAGHEQARGALDKVTEYCLKASRAGMHQPEDILKFCMYTNKTPKDAPLDCINFNPRGIRRIVCEMMAGGIHTIAGMHETMQTYQVRRNLKKVCDSTYEADVTAFFVDNNLVYRPNGRGFHSSIRDEWLDFNSVRTAGEHSKKRRNMFMDRPSPQKKTKTSSSSSSVHPQILATAAAQPTTIPPVVINLLPDEDGPNDLIGMPVVDPVDDTDNAGMNNVHQGDFMSEDALAEALLNGGFE